MKPIRCVHCERVIEAQGGRWLDRTSHGWCPGSLLPHTPVQVSDRQRDPLATSGGLR